jgi:hypothetical protein
MQSTNRLHIEYALLAIYFLSGLCLLFKLHSVQYAVVISGGLLSFLYFYASFWLYAQSGISTPHRIIAGLCYAFSIIASESCFLRWPGWDYYVIISFAGLALMTIITISNYTKPGYAAQLYRCIVFIVLLSFLYFIRSSSVQATGLMR